MAAQFIEDQENVALRERSGAIESKDQLVAFLYDLMRDHLPIGTVETLVRGQKGYKSFTFTNGWLAKIAEDMANRLRGG